jgi:CBS domain-containing protein
MEKTVSTPKNDSLQVGGVMLPLDKVPVMKGTTLLKVALEEMGRFRLGIACLVDADGRLSGILTDGDIRRKLVKVQKPLSALFVDDALDHAILNPVTVSPRQGLAKAVEIMGERQVWDLPVVEDDGRLVGLLHLHPAIRVLLGEPV